MDRLGDTLRSGKNCKSVKGNILLIADPAFVEDVDVLVTALCEVCDKYTNAQALCKLYQLSRAIELKVKQGKTVKQIESDLKWAGRAALKDITDKYDTERLL